MTIREYVKSKGFKIVGKLKRHPEFEWNYDFETGEKVHTKDRFYLDEAGNNYWTSNGGVCIVATDDSVI